MRRRFTFAEIEEMVRLGIIAEHERFELIGGELVPMSPKGFVHERLKISLARFWYQRLPDHLAFAQETTLRMDRDTFFEPDFTFFRTSDGLAALSPATVLLLVEVADSSLGFDLGRKARLYAAHGIRELWVIDAEPRVTHIFRKPEPEGYGEMRKLDGGETLIPVFASELAVTLDQLTLV